MNYKLVPHLSFGSQVVHVIQSFWIPWGKMTSRTTPSMTREPTGESLEESLREKSCRQAGDGCFCLRPNSSSCGVNLFLNGDVSN